MAKSLYNTKNVLEAARLDWQSYKAFVDNLAVTGAKKWFFNSGPEHAAIVMSRMFKNANEEVLMLCGGFTGDVSNDETYIKYLDQFLGKGGTRMRILAEQDLKGSENRSKIFGVLEAHKDRVEMGIMHGHLYSPGEGDVLRRTHFAVADGRMVRVETDVDKFTAEVNFNDEEEARELKAIFNHYWEKRTPIKFN